MSDSEITITLAPREARALIGAANLMSQVWGHLQDEDELVHALAGGAVSPLQSAAMRLELALIQAQVAP